MQVQRKKRIAGLPGMIALALRLTTTITINSITAPSAA